MEFENYTDRVKGFIQTAQTLALRIGHQQLTPLHILKCLLDDRQGLAATLIGDSGGDAGKAKSHVEEELAKLPRVDGPGAGQLHLGSETAKLFDQAEQAAKKAGDSYLTAEMLLLTLSMAAGTAAAKALKDAKVEPKKLNKAIDKMRKGRKATGPGAEDSLEALKKYARDLTAEAEEGRIDPVIGRDEEIRRTIQVLSRRT
ncbi:MAG: Clp protease N-terminal domain-containing protein, partial [Rhodospirillales bacterium]